VPHPDLDLDIPPLVTAGVLLAARQFALASGISWPSIEDLLAATGANPEEAHEIEDALLDQLATLAVVAKQQTPPPDLAGWDHSVDLIGLAVEMIRFIKQHPGCAQERHARALRGLLPAVRARAAAALLRRDDGRVCRDDRSAARHGGGLAARWAPRRRHDRAREGPTSHAWRAARLRSSAADA
jgi:hypothetical protein